MVYLAAPYPSGNPGISCILGICIFHHNLFRICSKIILTSSCFEKSCCILKFDAVVVLSAFSHPCIPILILLSSLHILWRFSSFPLFNVIYRGWPYLQLHWQSKHQKKKTISLFIFSFSSSPIYFEAVSLFPFPTTKCSVLLRHWKGKILLTFWFESDFEMCQYYHLQLLFAFRKYGGEEEINPIILQILASILSGKYIGLNQKLNWADWVI